MATRDDETPWWAEFPEPRSRCNTIEAIDLKTLIEEHPSPETRKFLVVDVRRTDWTGGTVERSINLPAQSFYPTRKAVYDLCKRASYRTVIFYCGSSNGRGPRCAAWMQDYVNEVGGELRCLVLQGGIREWVKLYGGQFMDAYVEKTWRESR